MKKVFLILSFMVLFSCKKEPQLFYEFDTVDYYHSNVSSDDIYNLTNDLNDSEESDAFLNIYYDENFPKSINDRDFIRNVKHLYKVQGTLDKKYFTTLKDIFSDHYDFKFSTNKCEPEFRDILIFKKDSKVTGICKICFECGISHLVSVEKSIMFSRTDDDYKRLQKMIKENFKQ